MTTPNTPPALTSTAVNTTLPLVGGGDLSASRTIALIGPLSGATSFTAHGVLVGEGTSAIAATSAGTAGQVLTSNGANADPTFQAAAGGGVTLVGAYNFGGAGVGRSIAAISGAVQMVNVGTENSDNMLEISKITATPQGGNALNVFMVNNLTGDAIAVSNLGTGNTINLAAANGANALLASGGDVVTQGSGVENLTTANAPFTFIGTCNGVPTGTPASHTGAAALIIDRNANRLYAYYGGSWHSLSP